LTAFQEGWRPKNDEPTRTWVCLEWGEHGGGGQLEVGVDLRFRNHIVVSVAIGVFLLVFFVLHIALIARIAFIGLGRIHLE
jgi:hypothetical protein